MPSFRRLEHDLDFPDAAWHGADGPLPVRRYPDEEIDPVQRAFLEAAVGVGDAPVEDHNRPGAVGVGKIPANTIDGQRVSNALAYLDAAAPTWRCAPERWSTGWCLETKGLQECSWLGRPRRWRPGW